MDNASSHRNKNVKDANELGRIREVSASIEEFDKIALRIAVELTLAHEDKIKSLDLPLYRSYITHKSDEAFFILDFLIENKI